MRLHHKALCVVATGIGAAAAAIGSPAQAEGLEGKVAKLEFEVVIKNKKAYGVVNELAQNEIIYDLTGDWKYFSDSSAGGATVNIIQHGKDVEGYWKANSGYCMEGSKWFKGKIKNDRKVTGTRYLCTGCTDSLNIKIKTRRQRVIDRCTYRRIPNHK